MLFLATWNINLTRGNDASIAVEFGSMIATRSSHFKSPFLVVWQIDSQSFRSCWRHPHNTIPMQLKTKTAVFGNIFGFPFYQWMYWIKISVWSLILCTWNLLFLTCELWVSIHHSTCFIINYEKITLDKASYQKISHLSFK